MIAGQAGHSSASRDLDDQAPDDSTGREYSCGCGDRLNDETVTFIALFVRSIVLSSRIARRGVQGRATGDPSAFADPALGSPGSFAQFRGFVGVGARVSRLQPLAVARDLTMGRADLGQQPRVAVVEPLDDCRQHVHVIS